MMLESYSIAGIGITQGVLREGYPGGFTRLLCSEKDWKIMQAMKANDSFISWIIVGNKRAIFQKFWIILDNAKAYCTVSSVTRYIK